jgi:hypothetical protein
MANELLNTGTVGSAADLGVEVYDVDIQYPAGVFGQGMVRPPRCTPAELPSSLETDRLSKSYSSFVPANTPFAVSVWANASGDQDWLDYNQPAGGTTFYAFQLGGHSLRFLRQSDLSNDFVQVFTYAASKSTHVQRLYYPGGFPSPDTMKHYFIVYDYPDSRLWIDGVEITFDFTSGSISGLGVANILSIDPSDDPIGSMRDELAIWPDVTDITDVMTLDECAAALASGYVWNGSAWVTS